MKKKFKLGVIGAGFMSSAIINGIIKSKIMRAKDIIVSDINQDSLDKLAKIGVKTTLNNFELSNVSEFTLFAIKPQNSFDVLNQIKNTTCQKFISIMAGVKKDKIKSVLGDVKVARCMPNTPCSIGYGAVGVDLSDFTDSKDLLFVQNLFSSLATVVSVDEQLLGAVTGVSGSSPAYFYLFLKGIVDAGVKKGLKQEDALNLAVNTMVGAGKMVMANPDKSLDDLINAVCSKGGTTIEAIKVYNDKGLTEISFEAVDACVKRSQELENL